MKKKIACIIPARLSSSRFPQKVLKSLAGRPILEWIWQRATANKLFDSVVFAIDSQATAELINSFGGSYVMTTPDCPSGTDRIIQALGRGAIEADIIVNWQGDSPLVPAQMIQDLLQSCKNDRADVWTLKKKIETENSVGDPNCVKVVTDAQGIAFYFSRSPIPYYRETQPFSTKIYYKHIGLYAYSRAALERIAHFSPTHLEQAEMLEQLRFMERGLIIRVHETELDEIGINVPQDLVDAEKFVQQNQLG